LLLVSHYVKGFVVIDLKAAMIAVVIIGLFNATFGLLLKIITLPIGILSFGVFFLVINGVVLWFASEFVPNFRVETFKAAFIGALALSVVHMLFGFLREDRHKEAWGRD
jgi:putative membrane protein